MTKGASACASAQNNGWRPDSRALRSGQTTHLILWRFLTLGYSLQVASSIHCSNKMRCKGSRTSER